MPAAETPPANDRGWLEPVLWSLALIAATIMAACLNETAGEVLRQGLAYLFTFITTPFVLETTLAFIGLFVVLTINSRRIAREGDGWVMMEVKDPVADEPAAEKKETGV